MVAFTLDLTDCLTAVYRSMGGVVAADVATYYGVDLLGGVVLLGSFPHSTMLKEVATQFIADLIPRLLDPSLANFGPTAKEFVESCVAYGDKLDQGIKYSWIGSIAGQHPDIRLWTVTHPQDETALMASSKTMPYLVLHGTVDRLIDGTLLRNYMNSHFGNFVFRLWENTGHAPFFDNPDQTNSEIVAFANRLHSVSFLFFRYLL